MIMCRQVARALSQHHYWELPWYRRVPMFIHIRLCVMCGKYHQQVVDMQTGVHEFLRHEEADEIDTTIHLSTQARDRIANTIKQTS